MTNPLHRVTITHVTALWEVAGVQESADAQMKSHSVHKEILQCVKYNAIFTLFDFFWESSYVVAALSTRLMFRSKMNRMQLPMSPGVPRVQRGMYQHGAMFCSNQYPGPLATGHPHQ